MCRRLLWVPLLCLGLLSCTGKQYAERVDRVVEVPDAFSQVTLGEATRDGWCTDFGEPELVTLVDRAMDRNLDLRTAWARFEQVEAVQRMTDSNLWPTASIVGDASRAKNPGFGPVPSFEVDTFKVSAPVAYEIDLWGRLAAQRSAAEYDANAAHADVESFAISLAAQVAEVWFDIVTQRQKMTLIDAQIETGEKFLELTKLRLAKGVATALDVTQQQQEIYRLRAQFELASALEENGRLRLAVLVGENPRAPVMGTTEVLPKVPQFPDVGVPATVLEQRPDVRSAQLRLKAADDRTVVAMRALLPSVRLSFTTFLNAESIGNLFDDIFWSIAGKASQPLFEGGRRLNDIERAEAAGRERLFMYAQTILVALREVESAIVQERQQVLVLEQLMKQLKAARVSLVIARDRYRAGALDYLRVLTALRTLQTLEQTMVDAQRQQLSNRVQTCRALGGDWTQKLEIPNQDDLDE